jgi:hypothetical protein
MSPSAAADVERVTVRDTWLLRNAAAETLIRAEEQVHRLLAVAPAEQIVELLEAFSPARSPGPEWTRTFDPLVERLWLWCAPATLAQVEADFRGRGPAWLAVANALAPQRGEVLLAQLRKQPSPARLPPLTLG